MLRTEVRRKGNWTKIPAPMRMKAHRKKCQVCDKPYERFHSINGTVLYYSEAIDHLVPRRWLNEHGIYEHFQQNLLSVCTVCHGKKKGFEDRLFQGDLFGYLQGLRSIGYPVERVVAFALSVGLKEFGGLRV